MNNSFNIYSIIMIIILLILVGIGAVMSEQKEKEEVKVSNSVLITSLIICCFLFVIYIMFIVKGYINIQHTTPTNYKLTLLSFIFGMIILGVIIGGLIQILLSEYGYETSCIIKTENDELKELINNTRSDNYYPLLTNQSDNCLMTEWSLSHVLAFMIVAFMVPTQWVVILLSGILWEIYEYFIDISDGLDIMWNSLGICIGVSIRYLVYDKIVKV